MTYQEYLQQHAARYQQAILELKKVNKDLIQLRKKDDVIKIIQVSEEKVKLEKIIKDYKTFETAILMVSLAIERIATTWDQFEWIRDIDTFEKYKQNLMNKSYWATESDISLLEKLLNIKVIIIQNTGRSIKMKDTREMVTEYTFSCNIMDESVDDIDPDFYIIVLWSGSHYELVQYAGRGIFTFAQLPPAIRDGYIRRCLERPDSSYNRITKFLLRKIEMQQQKK